MEKELGKKETFHGLARRSFMKLGGFSLLSFFTLNGAKKALGAEQDFSEPGITGNIKRYWEADGLTPRQRTVKVNNLSNDIITARVDGIWKQFKVKELNQTFRDFQSSSLVAIYDFIMANSAPFFGGVYCPAIISDNGIKRGDSQFKLNGAYKFVFPCPKEEFIDDITNGLMERLTDNVGRRIWMKDNWADQSLWNYKIQVGRDETVMGPADQVKRRDNAENRETHTFRNLMESPLAVILYLSSSNFISYEVRTICRYAAPPVDFTTVPDTYEEKISRFINVLGYTSHQVDHRFPAMIFYVVETFDNSMMEGFGEGTRIVRIRENFKNLYTKAKDRLIG
jgi:hypothetical protein